MNDFEQGWTTFSGKNAAEVSAIWPALCRQKLAKFGGDDSDPMKGCLVNPDLVPTLDEYRSEFDRWLREDRELRKSNGIMLDGKTPAQAWNSGAGVPPVSPVSGAGVPPVASSSVEPRGIPVSDRTRFVAFLRAFGKPQCVGKGCTVLFKRSDSQRSWIRYHSRALEPWLLSGEEVLVKISTEDISHAYVFQWIEAAGWKLIDCGGPDGGCPSIADIPANTGTEQVREITRQNRARRKAIRDGLNAEEQEAAFDDLRRGGLVPRDATNTEILLAGGTCSVVADVVAARRKTAADRKALIKELESGLSKDDLNNY
jgi:hypothetical protein